MTPDGYPLRGIEAICRLAELADNTACGDRVDAGLVLLARMGERLIAGTLHGDEAEALVRVLGGVRSTCRKSPHEGKAS